MAITLVTCKCGCLHYYEREELLENEHESKLRCRICGTVVYDKSDSEKMERTNSIFSQRDTSTSYVATVFINGDRMLKKIIGVFVSKSQAEASFGHFKHLWTGSEFYINEENPKVVAEKIELLSIEKFISGMIIAPKEIHTVESEFVTKCDSKPILTKEEENRMKHFSTLGLKPRVHSSIARELGVRATVGDLYDLYVSNKLKDIKGLGRVSQEEIICKLRKIF